ncbi:MAG: substrate-binding domain-containing protein [Rhodobacteraceae bacterium]|nr:substrate-binding domain-containing protein [Paracoccaceae bacterium]
MRLKDLSAELGLSPTTVSRALNGYPDVSEDTRLRVVEAARRHNYRPDARARGLAMGRARSIGHVIPTATRHEMVNPVFADFIAGAGETYARAGYDMVLSVVGDDDEARLYRDLAATRKVDGIIVHGPRTADPRVALLRELGLPFVVHGRVSEETGPYSWLDVNNRRAFYRATEFLLDLGHRRIALVNGLEYMDFALRRRMGYLGALSDRQIEADPALMSSEEMTEPYGYRAARQMLALDRRPTAFLTASLITALGVRRAVEERGLVLGRDVSIVTHDDELSYFSAPDTVPVFTATRSSVREAGRLAAEMLLDLVEAPGGPPRHRLLEAVLTVGQSTGPAPDRD